jgi:hypothetical protein
VGVDGFVAAFVGRVRARASTLRAYGAVEAATACEAVADELEQQFRSWWQAEMTVVEAAKESGYSPDRLRELVHEGRIPDRREAGSTGAIRVRRSDLPRRPNRPDSSGAVEALASSILLDRR